MQIQWERRPRFYLHLGPWWSRSARRDQGWMSTRRVREELALKIENGGLTTRHDTEKRCESFLIWSTFDWTLTFKWVKVSISFNFMWFFFMIRDDPSRSKSIRVDPTRTGGPSWFGPTFVPACQYLPARRSPSFKQLASIAFDYRLYYKVNYFLKAVNSATVE